MKLPDAFIEIVKSKGRRLTDLQSQEFAFRRADALAAIDALDGSRVAISGCDVLQDAGRRVEMTGDNWYCNRSINEDPLQYVERSRNLARRYIADSQGNAGVLYALVLTELGVTPIFVGEVLEYR